MNAMNKTKVPIPVYLLIGIIAISFSAIFVRWSDAPASITAMYRLLMTNALMLPFLWNYRNEITRIRLRDWLRTAASGIALGLHFLFWMDSLRFTTVASSTAILTLEPIFVLFGAFLLYGQRTSREAFLAMCVAIIGAICIGWGDFQFSGAALKGDFLSLIGTVAVALHMLWGKSLRERISAFVYSFFVFLFAGLVLAVTNVATGTSFTAYPAKEWGVFLLLAIVPTVFGHYVFNWLLKYMKASSVSMTVLGEPLGASLLAYFLLGEKITTIQLMAGCLLLVGVGLFLRSNEKD
ncbi:DMT family transporter [Paenibacillus aceris]|uniref:Drug/metabolite transporter (DMT)-like permease n=1 Tax=Paenibacillus aceris TaxID=869555 RepID=A0ABS4HSV2_9BACL|nr:DMT family transporter [Paenibacillus aceris]MBP1961711.1 drug/metabolite transporter (DMT)-like permease [Paenibacillus aceris]NHW34430.1 DMT family transporter [Paenibacillus aceris]